LPGSAGSSPCSVFMDCTHFRRQHLAYLDDTLPGDLMAAAQRHVLQCAACAAHDTRIRRSLMVARSLPAVVPRADFRARLDARLAECRNERVRVGVTTLLGAVVLIRKIHSIRISVRIKHY